MTVLEDDKSLPTVTSPFIKTMPISQNQISPSATNMKQQSFIQQTSQEESTNNTRNIKLEPSEVLVTEGIVNEPELSKFPLQNS
jgi:hypothetical protein